MDHFQKKEKQKRISLTKQLIDKGFSIKKLAEYFQVSEATVRDYIAQMKEIESQESGFVIKHPETEKNLNTLQSFTEKTTTTKDFFKDSNIKTDRIRCPLCNLFVNPTNITSIHNKQICKNCFKTLDAKKLDKLQNS
ncbi:HTH domain-containing protein [Candidatus Woesearchaeota archaeon]|nr:HTH domain-containing protein [Candidatus Woesearchaeota archaeon]